MWWVLSVIFKCLISYRGQGGGSGIEPTALRPLPSCWRLASYSEDAGLCPEGRACQGFQGAQPVQ